MLMIPITFLLRPYLHNPGECCCGSSEEVPNRLGVTRVNMCYSTNGSQCNLCVVFGCYGCGWKKEELPARCCFTLLPIIISWPGRMSKPANI